MSLKNQTFVIDDVQVKDVAFGGAQFIMIPDLDILDRVEVIRGPGSVLYGSDAYHGVFSMKTYQRDYDSISYSSKAGSDSYYSGSLNTVMD